MLFWNSRCEMCYWTQPLFQLQCYAIKISPNLYTVRSMPGPLPFASKISINLQAQKLLIEFWWNSYLLSTSTDLDDSVVVVVDTWCKIALSIFSQPEGAPGVSSPFFVSVSPIPFFWRSPFGPDPSHSRCIPVQGCRDTGLCAWSNLKNRF